MLQLPPNIRIGYKDYKLQVISEEDRQKNVGWHLPQQHRIEIAIDLPPREVVNTLIHEIYHAIFSHAGAIFKDEDEEALVECVANGWTQVFVDNPEVINWMITTCQRDINERTSSPH